MTENKIYLTLLNGTGYIFNANDYMRIRVSHRIVGSLVGTTSERRSTANECRLPVELTPLETRLLIDKGIAVLVSKQHSLLRELTEVELTAYQAKYEADLENQAKQSKAEKIQEVTQNIERILEGKRKKLLKAGQIEKADTLTTAAILEEISKNFVFDQNNALMEIHCAHNEPHVAKVAKMPSLKSLPSWDITKYRVFRDFWQRGKYITPGDAFGSDFLIYPGDPMIYHATHIVIVLHEPPCLKLMNFITKARLAVIVNKTCVLAYEIKGSSEDELGELHYQTIEWDGNMEQSLSAMSASDITMEDVFNR